jgi:hypothetical protein
MLTSNRFGALAEMLTDDNSSSDNEADNVDEYSQSMRDYESRQKHKHFVSTYAALTKLKSTVASRIKGNTLLQLMNLIHMIYCKQISK